MGSIDKRDSGKWRARWRDPHGRSQSKVFARKIDAEKHLTRVEHDKLVGTYIDVSSSRITYAQWAEQYMATTPKRATTAARDRNALKVWLVPHLGDMRLVAITPAHVRRVVDAMSARLKPASARTVYALLRASMNAAVERDLIMRSPCRGITLPPAEFAEPRFVSLDELHQIADAMPPQYEAMVYVAGVLGLRFSEIAGLRVERLDFLRRTLLSTPSQRSATFSVEFHPACEKWADALDQGDAEALLAAIRVLRDQGPTLGRPLVDTVKGSRHNNMKELRPGSTGRTGLRVLFAFDLAREAILLVGGDKSNDWTGWYKKNIAVADDRFDEHQTRLVAKRAKKAKSAKTSKGKRKLGLEQWENKVLSKPGAENASERSRTSSASPLALLPYVNRPASRNASSLSASEDEKDCRSRFAISTSRGKVNRMNRGLALCHSTFISMRLWVMSRE